MRAGSDASAARPGGAELMISRWRAWAPRRSRPSRRGAGSAVDAAESAHEGSSGSRPPRVEWPPPAARWPAGPRARLERQARLAPQRQVVAIIAHLHTMSASMRSRPRATLAHRVDELLDAVARDQRASSSSLPLLVSSLCSRSHILADTAPPPPPPRRARAQVQVHQVAGFGHDAVRALGRLGEPRARRSSCRQKALPTST